MLAELTSPTMTLFSLRKAKPCGVMPVVGMAVGITFVACREVGQLLPGTPVKNELMPTGDDCVDS